jgi:site-specific recombinase XerD
MLEGTWTTDIRGDVWCKRRRGDAAPITKGVSPHLLRHAVATTLLARGMPMEQRHKFLGPSTLETTQV